MKKLIAFILIISHMNTSMFLPQVPEDDQYDANGHQLDDINSVVEFVLVKAGVDKTADDEDDDTGQNFHMVKVVDNYFQPVFCEINNKDSTNENIKKHFPEYKMGCMINISPEIITPPPDIS
ncbi:MAG: hypothetical protein ABIP30_04820 [Ferruginibacter sp.]